MYTLSVCPSVTFWGDEHKMQVVWRFGQTCMYNVEYLTGCLGGQTHMIAVEIEGETQIMQTDI